MNNYFVKSMFENIKINIKICYYINGNNSIIYTNILYIIYN
jgi:hypothetical protein